MQWVHAAHVDFIPVQQCLQWSENVNGGVRSFIDEQAARYTGG